MAPNAPDPRNDHVVVLMGFDPHHVDPQGRSAVERLQEAFGIEFKLARHFVDNAPVVVKRHASEAAARRYEELLMRIGAYVDVRRESEDGDAPRTAAGPPSGFGSQSPRIGAVAAPPRASGSASDSPRLGGASPLGPPGPVGAMGRLSEAAQPPRRSQRPAPVAPAVKLPPVRGTSAEPNLGLGEDVPLGGSDEDIFSSKPQNVVRAAYEQELMEAPPQSAYAEDIAFADEDVAAAPRNLLATAPPAPEPRADQKTCPKCHFEQAIENVECDRCGIVFSKWLATHPDANADQHVAEVAAAHGLPTAAGPALVGVLDRAPRAGAPAGVGGVSRAASPERDVTRTAPGKPGAIEEEAPGFWASIPRALLVPVWGKGLIWQTILIVVLLGTSCMAAMPGCVLKLIATALGTFAFFGLLGRYFQSAAQVGLDGHLRGPDLPWGGDFGDLKGEVILPGIAYFVLAAVLFAIPMFTIVGAARDNAFEQQAMSGTWKIVEEGKIVSSTDTMLLIDTENNPIALERVEGIVEARTTDQRQVRVVASNHHIIFYDASGTAQDAWEDPNAAQESPVPTWALLTFLVPLILWPMCLTVSVVDGSLLSLFNPLRVLPAVFKGGLPYLTVVAIGVVISFGCSFASTLLVAVGGSGAASGGLASLGGVGVMLIGFLVGLGSFSYATGVQAFLMGRLAATRPETFSHLN